MSDSRWHFVCRLQKGGHRIFLDKHHQNAPVICDNSGKYPHETDDGPLYLDFKRKLKTGGYGKPTGLTIPVTSHPSQEGRYWTAESMEGSIKLMDLYSAWDVELTGDHEFVLIAEFIRKVQQRVKIETTLASPDLVEACRIVLEDVPGFECNCGGPCEGTCSYSVVRGAYEKAKGES